MVTWYGDAYWASEWDRKLKFPTFENPRWRTAAIWKNWKITISQPRLERFRQNLAWRPRPNLLSVTTVKNLKFPKSKIAAVAILKNQKSAISPERFNEPSRNLAYDSQCASEPDRKLKFSTFLIIQDGGQLPFWKLKIGPCSCQKCHTPSRQK